MNRSLLCCYTGIYITEACTTQAHLQQIPLPHINIAGSIERLCNVSQVRDEPAPGNPRQRPMSDGVMYGIEYEEVLLSELYYCIQHFHIVLPCLYIHLFILLWCSYVLCIHLNVTD